MSMEDLIRSMFTDAEGIDRGPAIQQHHEQFKDTEFNCDCGGDVYPFSPEEGLCSSCKTIHQLVNLDYRVIGESPEE